VMIAINRALSKKNKEIKAKKRKEKKCQIKKEK